MVCSRQRLKDVADSPDLIAFVTTDTTSTIASRGKFTGGSNSVREYV